MASSAILSLIAWPTPGICGGVAGPVGRDEVDRAAADGVGGAVVGDGLEHELALDLEHVADLVEDPGEVAVGQARGGGRRRHRVVDGTPPSSSSADGVASGTSRS